MLTYVCNDYAAIAVSKKDQRPSYFLVIRINMASEVHGNGTNLFRLANLFQAAEKRPTIVPDIVNGLGLQIGVVSVGHSSAIWEVFFEKIS
jgi:hypothetical protein